MSHATATRALRAVLTWDMPPPGSASRAAFDDHRRARVVDWLCHETGRGASECERIAREDAGDATLRSGQTILEVIRRAGAAPVSDRRAGLLLGTSPPGTARTPRTPAMVANVVLVAIDACSPISLFDRIFAALPRWSQIPVRTAEPRGACLQRTIELGLRAPARPAAAPPTPVPRESGR